MIGFVYEMVIEIWSFFMKTLSSQLKLNKISLLAGLGLSVVLIANTAHANTPKAFTAQEQADLMAKGMWYDERTGLIWDRCSVGQTWNGTTCEGVPKDLKYQELQTLVSQLNSQKHLGYGDWVIPTLDQLSTILDCPAFISYSTTKPIGEQLLYASCVQNERSERGRINSNLFINNIKASEKEPYSYYRYGYWSSTSSKSRFIDDSDGRRIYFFDQGYANDGISNARFNHLLDNYYARLVRTNYFGGNEVFKQIDVQRKAGYDVWKVEQDRIAKEKAELEAKRKAEEQARQAEQARKEQEAYDKKVANFRKNLKVGDDATAGMVIEIKGDLVKIQTNDRQCSQKDYNGKCMNYVNTPVEKWVKRRELYPTN